MAAVPLLGDIARGHVPVCGLAEPVADVLRRLEDSGEQIAAVIDEAGVVLGAVEKSGLDADPHTPVERVMESGPQTFRPSIPIQEMHDHMARQGLDRVLVTSAGGVLLGMAELAEAERALRGPRAAALPAGRR